MKNYLIMLQKSSLKYFHPATAEPTKIKSIKIWQISFSITRSYLYLAARSIAFFCLSGRRCVSQAIKGFISFGK